VEPYPEGTPRTLYVSSSGITEVALAFDQNMEPTIAYLENGLVKLRWFDISVNSIVTTSYAGASSPMLTMDDKRAVAGADNDVIFGYTRDGQVRYRQQRDRYLTEYTLGAIFAPGARILQLGMGTNLRLQFKIASAPPARYTDLEDDTLYVVHSGGIVDLHGGVVAEGVWRSRTYVLNEQPAPSWARVEGDYPVTLRVYGDDRLAYVTPPITSPEPFRLPSQRWRDWAFELVGATRVVEVAVANSREEL
jgi:hypothetical protein